MIRLGLRLTLAGGREAAIRLAITAVAVALGVMLLLAAVAGINAVNAQNSRYAWFGRLGLDGLENRRSGELSGGEAQRVALARGLVAEPEVLFADEPTGSLDSVTGEHVMELLTAVTREHGTTVILVTHEPRVAAYAGREVVVRDGKVGYLTSAAADAAPGQAAP